MLVSFFSQYARIPQSGINAECESVCRAFDGQGSDFGDSLPGPPLSNHTALVTLIEHGVTVGLGVRDAWDARNTRFTVDWVRISHRRSLPALNGIQAMLESGGRISEMDAVSLVTTNLENLLGIRGIDEDLVAYDGGSVFDQASKVAGVISQERMVVDLF